MAFVSSFDQSQSTAMIKLTMKGKQKSEKVDAVEKKPQTSKNFIFYYLDRISRYFREIVS
jgi:hypothetical protein